MSIKIKLILVIVCVLLAVGVLMGRVINLLNNYKLTENAFLEVKNTIDYSSQLVNLYLGQAQNSLNGLAANPLLIEILTSKDPKQINQLSEELTIINGNIQALENILVFEVNDSRCVVVASNREAASIIGHDLSDRDYCQGLLKTQDTYLSTAYIGSVAKAPVLAIVVPLRSQEGKILGFVLGSINLTELRNYLWDLQENSWLVLLDRSGVPFLDTTKKLETLDNPLTSFESETISRLSNGEKEGYFQDQNSFVGYQFDGSITVIYKKSAAKMVDLLNVLSLTVVLALLVTMFFTAVVTYLFIDQIVKRIARLSRVAEKIAGGDLEAKLKKSDLLARDETGILARAFNEMSIKLSDIYKNLEKKVKERTEKLEKSEMELKKTLAVSERANKLMVGRELEMIKLKKENEELKKSVNNK
ncbi:MAG: cache domain-containing protein [Candidatus Buchananbacteria bacterium]